MSATRATVPASVVLPNAAARARRPSGARCTSLYVACRAAGGASTYSSGSRSSSSGRSAGGSGRSAAGAGTWPGGGSGGFRPGGAAMPQDAAQLGKRLSELQELLREAAQIALATGPRGITRSAQAAQALLSVAREQALLLQAGQPPEQPPVVLRKLFERLGATYIKLGQFIASRWAGSDTGLQASTALLLVHACLQSQADSEHKVVRSMLSPLHTCPCCHAAPRCSRRSMCWSFRSVSTRQSRSLSRSSGGGAPMGGHAVAVGIPALAGSRCGLARVMSTRARRNGRLCPFRAWRCVRACLLLSPGYTRLGARLLRAAWRRRASLCLASASFVPRRRTVESELGMGLEDVFASVDREPLATASIAQVGRWPELAERCLLPADRLGAAAEALHG